MINGVGGTAPLMTPRRHSASGMVTIQAGSIPTNTLLRLDVASLEYAPSNGANLFDNKLTVGNIVMHERFGKGEILNLEGIGADRKAEIKFEVGGIKKLLLRFAKLDILG